MLGFHSTSNTLDVVIRPMTRSELCVEFEGSSWLDNRVQVIRGVPRVAGPFEIRINGGSELDLRSGATDVAPSDPPRIVVPDFGDAERSTRKLSPRKFRPGDNPDSGVSLGRRESLNAGDASFSNPGYSVRPAAHHKNSKRLASEISAVLSTPTRPRNSYRPAVGNQSSFSDGRLVTPGARSMSSSVPSIGSKLHVFECFVYYSNYIGMITC